VKSPGDKAKGSCFCGKIIFEILLPSKFVVNCHCSECRRLNGSAFVTWIGTWEDKLLVSKGKDCLVTFNYPEPKYASRQFCRHCGSQLFFRGSRWPGEVHVSRASIQDAVDKEIQADVFYSDKANWYKSETLPKYGGVSGTEKID
jgi:hypothetical protein